MAVLKQELNYSTYQNRLMGVLKSLEDSFKDSLNVSKSINADMNRVANSLKSADKALNSMVFLSSRIDDAITAFTTGFIPEFKHNINNVDDAIKKFNLSVNEGTKINENHTRSVDNNKKSIDDSTESNKKFQEAQFDTIEDMRIFNNGLQVASDFLMKIGSHANEYSNISNTLIQISGMQGDLVREFRSEMMGVVSKLNDETGGLYNPQQSYAQIAATMQGVTGNLEAMEEMARPVLLAQETLDVNISSIATLFNRFYTRYNFSSMSMEAMVEDIRKYSAGSAATGEDIVAAQDSLKVIMEYYAQGNEQRILDYNEQVAKMVGFYEDSGFDPNSFLVDLIKEIEGGEFLSGDSATAIALQKGGMSIEDAISAYSDPLRYDEISNAYIQGIYNIFDELKNSANRDHVLSSTFGLDPEQAMDIYNFVNRTGDLNTAFEEYVRTRDDTPLTDIVEDKYVSIADQINHWLEQIYAKLASIQETTGIGFTDVASLLSLVASGIALNKSLSNIGGIRGALGSFGRGGRATLSSIIGSGVSGAAPAGAIGTGNILTGATLGSGLGLLAGGALAVDGIRGIFDSSTDTTSKLLSTAQASAGIIGGAGLLGIGAATGPLAPITLALGGIAYLGNAAYKNATALSGNAAEVENNISELEKNLKDENKNRLTAISDLSYQFNQASSLEEQKQLMLESGLFKQEDLAGKQEDQLKSLIDSYKSAVSAMNDVTDGALELADKYYKEQQNEQQKGFIEDLKKADLSDAQRKDIISLLQTEISDTDLQKKFEKVLKDGKVSKSEFNDLLYGGKNSWFDQTNLTDKSVSVGGMQAIAGYLGWDKSYVSSDSMEKVAELYNNVALAYRLRDPDKLSSAWQAVIDSGLEQEVREVYDDKLSAMKIPGYADGTNYVDGNKLAVIHDGEAITPKKYNPAANMNELEALREQIKDRENQDSKEVQRVLKETAETLQEIMKFLAEWKADNIRRETMTESRNRFSRQRNLVNGYLG